MSVTDGISEKIMSLLENGFFNQRISMLIEANISECTDLCSKYFSNKMPENKVLKELIEKWFKEKSSDSFIEAWRDFSVDREVSKVDFFLKHWRDELLLYDFKIKRSELYKLCSSSRFSTRVKDASAIDFINGVASEAMLSALSEVLAEKSNLCGLFKKIPSVDEFNDSVYEGVLSKKFSEIKSKMLERCLIGSGFFELDFSDVDPEVVRRLKSLVEQKHFSISGNVILSRKGPTSLDFETEEDVLKLASDDGYDYWQAAWAVRNKIIPEFLNQEISIVTEKLENVRVKDDLVTIKKRKTRTNSYALLYEQLEKKGFKVSDDSDSYSLTWR